jgi:hypothetical protein
VVVTPEVSELLAARGGPPGAVPAKQVAGGDEAGMVKALELLEELQQLLEAVPAVPEDLLLDFLARYE